MFFLALITQVYAVVSDVINLFKKKINKKLVNSNYTREGEINRSCVACAIISYTII